MGIHFRIIHRSRPKSLNFICNYYHSSRNSTSTMKLFIVASFLITACVAAHDVVYESDNYVYDQVDRDGSHGGSYGAPEPVYGAPAASYGAPSYGGGHGRGGDVDPHTSFTVAAIGLVLGFISFLGLLIQKNESENICKATKDVAHIDVDMVDTNTATQATNAAKINEIIDAINDIEDPDCTEDWW